MEILKYILSALLGVALFALVFIYFNWGLPVTEYGWEFFRVFLFLGAVFGAFIYFTVLIFAGDE
jgi:hypothetical protein